MNRHDEIKCKARDIASHIHIDPEARDEMADQLIELIGLMLDAVGKYVAGEGEASMNEAYDAEFEPDLQITEAEFEREKHEDAAKAHNRYLVGESIQSVTREIVDEAKAADVERYHRVNPGSSCRCGHVRSVHESGEPCVGEQFNGEPCKGGPDHEFEAYGGEPVWTHQDRRPVMLRRTRDALLSPQGRWITATGALCVCVPAPITDGTGRVVGFDPHPGRCTWQQGEQPPLTAECCRADEKAHICGFFTGPCCYSNNEVCPDHG